MILRLQGRRKGDGKEGRQYNVFQFHLNTSCRTPQPIKRPTSKIVYPFLGAGKNTGSPKASRTHARSLPTVT
jgi:hypothetical protein